MARTGVSFANVVNAASQLQAQGKNPTIEQVRLVLGTGSSTTIAGHLKEWKAQQAVDNAYHTKDSLPQEVIALMKGLWQRLLSQADSKVATIQQSTEAFMSGFKAELERLKRENAQWQQKYHDILQIHQRTQDNFKHSHELASQQHLAVIKELKQQNKKLTLELDQIRGKIKRLQANKK